jgi:hypothetical protein
MDFDYTCSTEESLEGYCRAVILAEALIEITSLKPYGNCIYSGDESRKGLDKAGKEVRGDIEGENW